MYGFKKFTWHLNWNNPIPKPIERQNPDWSTFRQLPSVRILGVVMLWVIQNPVPVKLGHFIILYLKRPRLLSKIWQSWFLKAKIVWKRFCLHLNFGVFRFWDDWILAFICTKSFRCWIVPKLLFKMQRLALYYRPHQMHCVSRIWSTKPSDRK